MSTLVVTAHPDPESVTRRAADAVVSRLDPATTAEVHLADEGFDPRFTIDDLAAYRRVGATPHDVLAHQARLDDVSDLVLVFPVYWWSMPALLKGWIDRVFIGGWAFGYDDDGQVVPWLGRMTAHLLPVAGASESSYARHGYTRAFDTQVHGGIIDFCGLRRGQTAFVYESDTDDDDTVTEAIAAAAGKITSAVTRGRHRGWSATRTAPPPTA